MKWHKGPPPSVGWWPASTAVEIAFPSIEDFRVEHIENVRPVEYVDSRGRIRNEWPPVARWRVGQNRHCYVLKPSFVDERWNICGIFAGTSTKTNYDDEKDKLWQILRWSVEGKHANEINRLLGNAETERPWRGLAEEPK